MSSNGSGSHPYDELVPERVLDAVESFGVRCSGTLQALNSYENRVYQVGLDDNRYVVVKFYRPNRWSDAAIREEHAFTLALDEREIPVVPPLSDTGGETLFRHGGFRFALFARVGGYAQDPDTPLQLTRLGRYLGRIHMLGAVRDFQHRPRLDIDSFGYRSAAYLLEHDFIPDDLRPAYRSVAEHVLERLSGRFTQSGGFTAIRLHGDVHRGNILWTAEGPRFVDFDDCRMGPAVQDLWMLVSGSSDEMAGQLAHLLDGYREFADFNTHELILIEPLRTLRMLHYSAWLARRWTDPAFPRNFPWFNTQRYWEQQILGLREQLAALDEPPPAVP